MNNSHTIQPLVSIIIPVFNAERTIKETLESVLRQTYKNLEILIINDGSTDNSLSLIETYKIKDSRISIYSYPHRGVSVSRNKGIDNAIGTYISFLDADDIWLPEKIEHQVVALQNNPEASIAYSWVQYIDEQKKFIHNGPQKQYRGIVLKELLEENFIQNGSNILAYKLCFTTVRFDPMLSHSEDRDMWIRLALTYQFVVVPEVSILYRKSSSSATAHIQLHEEQGVKMFENIYKNYIPLHLQYLKSVSLYNFQTYLLNQTFTSLITFQNLRFSLHLWNQRLKYEPAFFRHFLKNVMLFYKIVKIFFKNVFRKWGENKPK